MNADRSSGHPVGAFRVVLTGGVGSGKSTVGRLLTGCGAHVIDADAVAREVVEVGSPGLAAIEARFGSDVLQPDGALNRAGLAAIVFADADALADLNAITHPLVRTRSEELLAEVPVDQIAVYEVPLLAEGGPFTADDFEFVVVVETPMPVRIARLTERGLPPEQAQARIAAQATDEQRRAIATELVLNDSSTDDLARAVDALWLRLLAAQAQRR